MKRRPAHRHQGLGLRQHAGGVRSQITAQTEFLAGEHDRGAVVSNRTADQNAIAGAHKLQSVTGPVRRNPTPVAAR
jgi:hypothetical protein